MLMQLIIRIHFVKFGTRMDSGHDKVRVGMSAGQHASVSDASSAVVRLSRAGKSPWRSCLDIMMRRILRR